MLPPAESLWVYRPPDMSGHVLGRPHFALKIAHSRVGIWTLSNTWFPGPIRVHIPNSISIGSADFAQLFLFKIALCMGWLGPLSNAWFLGHIPAIFAWLTIVTFTSVTTGRMQLVLRYGLIISNNANTRHTARTSTRWRFSFGAILSCAPIANSPNSALVGGTPDHSANLHSGRCSSVGMRPRRDTDTQTDRHTDARDHYISRRLRLTRDVMI